MIHQHMDFLISDEFLLPLGIPAGTQLQFDLLGQGEYNLNYTFAHPVTGQKLVLRDMMDVLYDRMAYWTKNEDEEG